MQATGDDRVRVQFVLGGPQAANAEVIKKVTAGHEVVDVGGFVFRRKRKAPAEPEQEPEQEQDAPGPPASPSTVKHGLHLTPAKAPADGQRGDDAPGTGARQAAALAASFAVAPAAPDHGRRVSIATDELTYLVQWLLTTELKRSAGLDAGQVAATAAAITDRFAVSLQQHLAAHPEAKGLPAAAAAPAAELSGQQAELAAAASRLPGLVALPFQMEKLTRALQEKRDKLLQEEAAWLQLEGKYAQLMAPQQEAAQQQGPPGASQQAGDGAAAAAPSPAAAPAGGAAPAASELTVVPASPPAAGGAPLAPGSAAAAKHSALQSMALRVEGLCALVTKMEQLAADAEAAASKLQVEYHADKFSLYPHVNSPAFLIKSIVHPASADG